MCRVWGSLPSPTVAARGYIRCWNREESEDAPIVPEQTVLTPCPEGALRARAVGPSGQSEYATTGAEVFQTVLPDRSTPDTATPGCLRPSYRQLAARNRGNFLQAGGQSDGLSMPVASSSVRSTTQRKPMVLHRSRPGHIKRNFAAKSQGWAPPSAYQSEPRAL